MKKPDQVVKDYCNYYGFTPADLKKNLGNRVRKKVGKVNLSELRQALALLLRRSYGLTFQEIADLIGWHDHTTAHYAVKKGLEKYEMNDQIFMRYWENLEGCIFIEKKRLAYPQIVGILDYERQIKRRKFEIKKAV